MLTFATVGTSWITERFIESAIHSKQFQLAGVYSRSEDKARKLVEKYHVERYFTEIEDLAKHPEIDVIYIASPNSVHFENALLFLKNKKHVICEKPMFSNASEMETAYRTAEENGVFLFEAIRNIHAPNYKILKDKLAMAGPLRSAVLPYIQYSSRYDAFLNGEEPNIFSAKFSGGALVDLGVYPLFLAVGLFGEPKKVTYHPVLLRTGVDGSGTLVLEYDGFLCTILCSKVSHSELPCEIHGEKGTFFLQDPAPISEIKWIDSHTKESQIFSEEQEELDMAYECRDFADIIQSQNHEEYERLKNWSQIVVRITEEARKQNNIIFGTEK